MAKICKTRNIFIFRRLLNFEQQGPAVYNMYTLALSETWRKKGQIKNIDYESGKRLGSLTVLLWLTLVNWYFYLSTIILDGTENVVLALVWKVTAFPIVSLKKVASFVVVASTADYAALNHSLAPTQSQPNRRKLSTLVWTKSRYRARIRDTDTNTTIMCEGGLCYWAKKPLVVGNRILLATSNR